MPKWVDRGNTVKRIQAFLWQTIGTKQIRDIAISELTNIHLTNGNHSAPSETEINHYIENHYQALRQRADSAIKATAEKMIAGPRYLNLIRDLGIVTLILVTPLYPICSYIAVLFSEDPRNWTDIGTSLACCLLLLVPLVAYLIATFKNSK